MITIVASSLNSNKKLFKYIGRAECDSIEEAIDIIIQWSQGRKDLMKVVFSGEIQSEIQVNPVMLKDDMGEHYFTQYIINGLGIK